jgi:parvulin-like peptidyl-prolyl isomerase
MRLRSLIPPALLLLGTVTFAADKGATPWKPAAAQPAAPADSQPSLKYRRYVNGVPDTGQFLPDTTLLATMDERRITVGEFRRAWFISYALDRPPADSAGRLQFLTSMVDKEVLGRLARQVNRPFDFEDRSVLREYEQRIISNLTFQRLVADSSQPSEAELRRIYEQARSVRHLQHILTPTRADAERARTELEAGRITWPQAVARYSVAQRDSGPAGDLGWIQRHELPLEQVSSLWELKDGQLSSVFGDEKGFQLVRVLGRRANPMPPYERVRNILANEIMPLNVARRVEDLRVILRRRAGVVYDTANIEWAAARFASARPEEAREDGTPVLDLTGPLPRVTRTDTARVLARWNQGQFTMGRFYTVYRALPPFQRPKVYNFDAFRSFLDGSLLDPYLVELGMDHGIGRDSATLAMLDGKREELRVEHLFRDSVEVKAWVTPAERRKYYESRLADFWSRQSVRYAAIPRATEAAAESLATRLRHGEKAEAILREDSLRLGRSTGSIRDEREDQPGPFFATLTQDLKTGEVMVRGPIKDGEYAVIQKLEHDSGRQLRFEEVEKIVDESVQNLKAEQLLKEFIARHRVGHRIALYPERLMLVKLTDPTED